MTHFNKSAILASPDTSTLQFTASPIIVERVDVAINTSYAAHKPAAKLLSVPSGDTPLILVETFNRIKKGFKQATDRP